MAPNDFSSALSSSFVNNFKRPLRDNAILGHKLEKKETMIIKSGYHFLISSANAFLLYYGLDNDTNFQPDILRSLQVPHRHRLLLSGYIICYDLQALHCLQ